MLFVVGGIIWQVVEVNRSGRSPLAVLFESEEAEPSASPESTPVTTPAGIPVNPHRKDEP